jgi:hypothetical protein
MKKTYQIKINQGKESKTFEVVPGSTKGQALTIKAVEGARYQLVDKETTYGPENIRTSRIGKDLNISFEGSNKTDVVIEDYYKATPEGFNGLIGEAETGKFYEYIPENASGLASVPMLSHSSQVVGMALGGAEVASSGAAVGVLAAGLFSPWLLGAGALGVAAAAGGGGGSGAANDTTPPAGQTGALKAVAGSDSGKLGDNLTSVTKPTITGKAEAGSTVEVSFRDSANKLTVPYKTTADANGDYTFVVPNDLLDTSTDTKGTKYTPVIKATDAAGNSSTADGTPFVVDTKALDLTLTIDADTNNNGVISYIENGNSETTPKDLNVTASFDKTKANVGDEVHFQLPGGTDNKVTLTQAMVDAGQAVFKFVDRIVNAAVLKVSAWFVDTTLNQSAIVTDEAKVDLSVKVNVTSIAGDDMINAAETSTGGVWVKGTATAQGTVSLIIGTTQIASTTVNANGSWSCQIDGTKFSSGTSLTAKLVTTEGAILQDAHNYIYDNLIQVKVTADSSAKTNTLQGNESGTNKMVAYKGGNDVWEEIPEGTSVVLPDSTKFLMADVSGNVYLNYSGTNSTSKIVEYGAMNSSTNPSDLTLSQLLSSPEVLHIDTKTLAVKSVNIADGKANIMSIDSLDVLNHGVLNVLEAGLGQNPQFKVFGDASGDSLKLTNLLGGKGVWTAAETVTLDGDSHTYTHYSAYALGLEIDLLVDKNIAVTIV